MRIAKGRARKAADSAVYPGNFDANSYARLICERKREGGVSNGHRMRRGAGARNAGLTSSSCRVFSVDDSALGNEMKLKALPVAENVSESTAEMSAPTAMGKLLLTCCSFIEWRTIDCSVGGGR